jgi:hypothetical protein
VSILATADLNDNPSSFLNSPAMRKLMAKHFERVERESYITSKSVALYKESKNINNINNNLDLNINNINTAPVKKRSYQGLFAKVHSDPSLLKLQEWGVDAPFIYAAVRDCGEERVKEIVWRLSKLGDGYFRQGQPVNAQRGRLFNKEIRDLKNAK